MKKIVLFLILFISLLSPMSVLASDYADGVELLDDAKFANGFAVSNLNTYLPASNATCAQRWKSTSSDHGIDYDKLKWTFVEISERAYFCEPDNSSRGTPSIDFNLLQYISPNYGVKSLLSDRNGTVRMKYNTGLEWRAGCNLSLPWPDVNPPQPRFGDQTTNWPHLLLNQTLSTSFYPSRYNPPGPEAIPLNERVGLSKYSPLTFSGQFKLNKVTKTPNSECSTEVWRPLYCPTNTSDPNYCQSDCCTPRPNHAIFYVAFILSRNTWLSPRQNNTPNIVYQLLPLVYSEDGVTNFGGTFANLMGDQFGDRTYFAKFGENTTTGVHKLTIGSPTFENITIDVAAFSRQVLHEINPNLSPDDYFIQGVLVGWEIWGAYDTDVEIKSLSLKGQGGPTSAPTTILTATPALIVGDYDGDGIVNLADFGIWKGKYLAGQMTLVEFGVWKKAYLK